MLAKGQHIVPVIGARMRRQLSEALGALQVEISAGDLARIEATISASVIGGTRYDQNQMRLLDSEKQ